MIKYDTVAARFHPGGNTGTKKSYFTESPWDNWANLVGKDFKEYGIFIMLKNRAAHLVWREICIAVRLNKTILKDPKFYLYAVTALLVPGFILREITNFYRHNITRIKAKIIERGSHG